MTRAMSLKVSVVDICALEAHGLGHSVRFMGIMKDMKLCTLSLFLDIILAVMDAAGIRSKNLIACTSHNFS